MTRFPSRLIPQADVLPDIAAVTDAVSAGATTFQAIAAAIGKVERQGRYYRLAAEQLGLLLPTSGNHSALSPLGQSLIGASNDEERREIFVQGMMQNPILNGILNLITDAGDAGRSRAELEQWLKDNTTATGATPARRVSTIRAWLASMGLVTSMDYPVRAIKENDSIARLAPEETDPYRSIIPDLPLVAYGGKRTEPEEVPPNVIQYDIDRAKLERAVKMHELMVAEVAEKARAAAMDCRRNKFIDLFCFDQANSHIFEFKTNTQENCGAQIRRAVSQLYEYQWRQRLDSSRLVVVLQQEPIKANEWTLKYLTDSRHILPVWRSQAGYEGPSESQASLPWLVTA